MRYWIILLLVFSLVPSAYAAFPTEGSPWVFNPEPSADSFGDGFTNNTGGNSWQQSVSFSLFYAVQANGAWIGAWFKNQDHTGSNQTAACNANIRDRASAWYAVGPSCRHTEGNITNAVDCLAVIKWRSGSSNTKSIYYANMTNGSHATEGTSNDSWNYNTYNEMKISVTGTGAGGTTMYGWMDGNPLNTASVSNVTSASDAELSSGIYGNCNVGNVSEVFGDDWWAEAYAPSVGGGQVISIMITKIKDWFSKPAHAQGAEIPRYYICSNIGDGSDISPYRPKVDDVARAKKLSIGYDTEIRMIKQVKGAIPASNWALVRVTGTEAEHDILAADIDVFQLPDKTANDSLSLAERQEVNTKLQTIGVRALSINDTHQTLIKKIGAKCLGINEKDYKEKEFLRIK